jgi:Sulfotransferase domain
VGRRLSGAGALPTFFVIGAPKAGTTSLHYYLDAHPEVQMSALKEPHFFSPSGDAGDERWRVRSLADYQRLFDSTVAVRGEASPSYTMHPLRQGVPERISALVPDAKFIYLVRDPVERTLSHYHQLVATVGERRPPRETLGDVDTLRSPCVCASLYALQLERYLQSFPQSRILVVDQDELRSARRDSLRRIFAFLEVDETLDCSRFDEELLKSSERRAYPPLLARLIALSLAPRAQWVPHSLRRSLRRGIERALLPELPQADFDPELRVRLEETYAPDVQRLRKLTGQAFASWSV